MGIYSVQKRLNAMRHSLLIWSGLVILANVAVACMVILFPTIWSFYIMMVSTAVFTLLIPYIFGEKNIKKMAAVGLVLISISGFVAAAVTWEVALKDIYGETPEPVMSPEGLLVGGRADPHLGYDDSNFTFFVTYTGEWSSAETQVHVNLTSYLLGGAEVEQNVSMVVVEDIPFARTYQANLTLDEKAIYMFQFVATDGDGSAVTEWCVGPINVEKGEAQPMLTTLSTVIILIQSGMLFIIGLLMYWWLRKGKEERAKWAADANEAKPAKGGGFKCTECGAEVGAEDKFCPKCGVKFDESPAALSGSGSEASDKGDGQPADGGRSSDAKPVEYQKPSEQKEEGRGA